MQNCTSQGGNQATPTGRQTYSYDTLLPPAWVLVSTLELSMVNKLMRHTEIRELRAEHPPRVFHAVRIDPVF